MNLTEVGGRVPTGQSFDADIDADVIVLRVGDRICIAAPSWLDLDQAGRVAESLNRLTKGQET